MTGVKESERVLQSDGVESEAPPPIDNEDPEATQASDPTTEDLSPESVPVSAPIASAPTPAEISPAVAPASAPSVSDTSPVSGLGSTPAATTQSSGFAPASAPTAIGASPVSGLGSAPTANAPSSGFGPALSPSTGDFSPVSVPTFPSPTSTINSMPSSSLSQDIDDLDSFLLNPFHLIVIASIVGVVTLLFFWKCCKSWKLRREKQMLRLQSTRVDAVLGDMQMVGMDEYDGDDPELI